MFCYIVYLIVYRQMKFKTKSVINDQVSTRNYVVIASRVNSLTIFPPPVTAYVC